MYLTYFFPMRQSLSAANGEPEHAGNVSVTSGQRYSWMVVMELALTSSVAAEPVMSPGSKVTLGVFHSLIQPFQLREVKK